MLRYLLPLRGSRIYYFSSIIGRPHLGRPIVLPSKKQLFKKVVAVNCPPTKLKLGVDFTSPESYTLPLSKPEAAPSPCRARLPVLQNVFFEITSLPWLNVLNNYLRSHLLPQSRTRFLPVRSFICPAPETQGERSPLPGPLDPVGSPNCSSHPPCTPNTSFPHRRAGPRAGPAAGPSPRPALPRAAAGLGPSLLRWPLTSFGTSWFSSPGTIAQTPAAPLRPAGGGGG